MRKITTGLLMFLTLTISAQKHTISGTVTDAQTGEHLISANIYNANNLDGTITNAYGFYSLKQNRGKVSLKCSFMGYNSFESEIELNNDISLNITLEPNIQLDEVVIASDAPINNVRSTQTSMVELPIKTLKSIPMFMGEVDVIKGLQLMPGIQAGTEGASGLYVRGGSSDQNLILLDGVPVYNVNHLMGIFSVFNGDALNSVQMYKGGFPARFGGRLSSVVDIRLKEGNKEEIKGSATIGLLASKLSVDGPIGDKTTFLVSARRTYFDLFTYPFQKAISASSADADFFGGYFFHDLNAKISHKINAKNRLYLSSYLGTDKFFMKDNWEYDTENGSTVSNNKIGVNWGNKTTALRWNSQFSRDLFSNVTLTYTNYKFKTYDDYSYNQKTDGKELKNTFYYEYFSGINDIGLNHDLDYMLSSNHKIKMGYNGTMHFFSPGVLSEKNEYDITEGTAKSDTVVGKRNIPAFEFHAYAEDEIRLGRRVSFNIGGHFSSYTVNQKTYTSLEPRLSGRLLITNNLSFKASYITMKQYLHLLTSNTISLPTDLWVPSTENIKPQEAWQVAGGFSYSLNNQYLFTVEGFYKHMNQVTEYKEGHGLFNTLGDWENAITQGQGESYGSEFMIKKNAGKTNGWISYTLSWAHRHFDDISQGQTFPFKYDRRHQLNIVGTHKISEKWDVGASWQFGSGYPFTLGNQQYQTQIDLNTYNYFNGDVYTRSLFTEHVQKRNNYRMDHYHRLDINVNRTIIKKQRKRTLSFGMYNVYMRKNPFIVMRDDFFSFNPSSRPDKLVQYSLPAIPYIRWTIDLNKIK